MEYLYLFRLIGRCAPSAVASSLVHPSDLLLSIMRINTTYTFDMRGRRTGRSEVLFSDV